MILGWSTTWQFPFNVEKCKCMHIGREKTSHTYTMDQHILNNVNEEKDLGVIIDRSRKFHTDTSLAVKKANSILEIICFTRRVNITTFVYINGPPTFRVWEYYMGTSLHRGHEGSRMCAKACH